MQVMMKRRPLQENRVLDLLSHLFNLPQASCANRIAAVPAGTRAASQSTSLPSSRKPLFWNLHEPRAYVLMPTPAGSWEVRSL
jgi:hypothetical protein